MTLRRVSTYTQIVDIPVAESNYCTAIFVASVEIKGGVILDRFIAWAGDLRGDLQSQL